MYPTHTVSPPKKGSFAFQLRRSPQHLRQSPDLLRPSRSPVSRHLANVKATSVSLSKGEFKAASPEPRMHSTTLSGGRKRAQERSSPRLRSGGWTANDYQNVDKLLKEAEDISFQMSLKSKNAKREPVQMLEPSQRKTLVARVIQRIRQSTGGTPDETRASMLTDSGNFNIPSGRETPTVRTVTTVAPDVEDESGDHSVRRPPQPIPVEDSPFMAMPEDHFDEIFIATTSPAPSSYSTLRDENRPPESIAKWSSRSDVPDPDYKMLYEALQIRFRDEQAKCKELESRLARKSRENEELQAQLETLRRGSDASPQRIETGWMAVLQQEIQELKSRVSATEHHNKEIRSKLTS